MPPTMVFVDSCVRVATQDVDARCHAFPEGRSTFAPDQSPCRPVTLAVQDEERFISFLKVSCRGSDQLSRLLALEHGGGDLLRWVLPIPPNAERCAEWSKNS